MSVLSWAISHQPFGAQLLGARVAPATAGGRARELLFLSSRSLGPRAPVRGGVPVLFPQFNELGPLPKHGLVRARTWSPWDNGYRLDLDPASHPSWPHSARLMLRVSAVGARLDISLEVENTGSAAFDWTGGLHPYFAVDDLRRARLFGLSGCAVSDRYDPGRRTEQREAIQWQGEACECLYGAAPVLELDADTHRLRLTATGFDQWMVWNPGEQLGASITDLGADDCWRFVCVEPVIVSRPRRLEAGQRFEGRLGVEVIGC